MEFKKILVPLDGSTLSEAALEPALALARAMKGEVILLTALTSAQEFADVEYFGRDVTPLPTDTTSMRARLLDYLNSLCASRAGANVPMRTLVLEGDAVECIVETAVSLPADLVIMGAHGRSGVARLLLGSTTEKVARQVPCPILAIRPAGPIKNVLIAVTQLMLAEHALDPGFALAGCFNAQVHLLLIAQGGPDHPGEIPDKTPGSHAWDDMFRYEEAYLEDLVDRYQMDTPIKTAVRLGKPETAVLSYAQAHQIDLIIMGARPYSRWRRFLYGSVAEKVLREGSCSVMIVRPNQI